MSTILEKRSSKFSTEQLEELLFRVYLTRFTDEKMTKLSKQNKGGTFHLPSLGHEIIGVVSGISLERGVDWGLPYYRDRAFAIGLGAELKDLFASFLAREGSYHSSGRQMPEHFSSKPLRIPCQSSVVGAQFLHGVGVAKALQLSGKQEVVYVSAGDGATSQGDFHEALNFSCIHKLGVIFVIQDNDWAISVTKKEQTAGGSIAKMVSGYEGLAVHDIDGCDVEAVTSALTTSVDRARRAEGPTVIVAKVPRLGAHSSSDDPRKYKSEAMVAKDQERDPVPRLEKWILERSSLTSAQLQEVRERAFEEVERAASEAEKAPNPKRESVMDHVFKKHQTPHTMHEGCPLQSGESVVMVDALNHALQEVLAEDEKVVVFGQDVAHGKGGVFGVTQGLTARFGERQCFNTPLAESTIVGLSIGMSFVEGFKPVAEVQFADYLWTGINQLFNELSSVHYRSNGEWNCQVVVRMPYGGYIQGGPYHSQSIEGFLAHCPGLKVVIPSTAADAKRLLKSAIEDPNPVVFLEHKGLYRQRVYSASKEPSSDARLPLGKARVVREGEDVTLVCYGMMAFMASEVAGELAKEGISVEVIDLRTIVPLDEEAILHSVKSTGKLLIAHEAASNCGFGAEVAARVAEKAFDYLDAPIVRVTGKDAPVPYSKDLEEAHLPQPKDLMDALRTLARY